MADIFISYKSEDRPRVAPLVAALEADGLTVWWDAHIGGGDDWRDSIQSNLDAARLVVVAWSRRTVGPEGRFVRDEASRAQRRGAYLPVLIDAVEPPLGFGETQALSLVGWSGDAKDERYQAVLDAVRARLAGERPKARAASVRRGPDRRTLMLGGGAAVIATAAAGGGAWWWLGREPAAGEAAVAVLPFADLSGDPAHAWFAGGITEELRSTLGRVPALKVVGRVSSEAVAKDDLRTGARKLGAGSMLTGSVRHAADTVRVNAQLIDGRTGLERWSQVYDRAPGDALAVQTEIAEQVVQALRLRLDPEVRARLSTAGTENIEAYEAYLRGREMASLTTAAGVRDRAAAYRRAVALDPNFAAARARLSASLAVYASEYAKTPAERDALLIEAEREAREAIRLAPRYDLGHAFLGLIQLTRLDLGGAFAHTRRAQAVAGSTGFPGLSGLLSVVGRHDEAIAAAEKRLLSDPLNPGAQAGVVFELYYARRYEPAITAARRLLRGHPQSHDVRTTAGDALQQLGRLDEAATEYAAMPADYWARQTGEALLAASRGERAETTRRLEALRREHGDQVHFQYAQIHARLGETDAAFAALESAWRFRDPGLVSLRVDPWLDPLRQDPRYPPLERLLNFPPV